MSHTGRDHEARRIMHQLGSVYDFLARLIYLDCDDSPDRDEGLSALGESRERIMRAATVDATPTGPCRHPTLTLDSDGDKATRTCDQCGRVFALDGALLVGAAEKWAE